MNPVPAQTIASQIKSIAESIEEQGTTSRPMAEMAEILADDAIRMLGIPKQIGEAVNAALYAHQSRALVKEINSQRTAAYIDESASIVERTVALNDKVREAEERGRQ